MSKVTASAQVVFFINAWDYPNHLSLTPQIYQKTFPQAGVPEYKKIDGVAGNTSGGYYYTDITKNNYEQVVGYNPKSERIRFSFSADVFDFQLDKSGRDVTYSPPQNGTVYAFNVLYPDIIGAVALKIGGTTPNANESVKAPVKINDVYFVQNDSTPSKSSHSTTRATSKTIPDHALFSFLWNIPLHFDGPIHQLIRGSLIKIDSLESSGLGSYGGYFSLTQDQNKPYPDGKTRLVISDGLSEGTATVVFQHNAANKTVTITVESHTFKLCELRDLTEVGVPEHPNTLCVTL
ncbi:hypothetical protein ACYZT3_27715 [Pseudomonas sp. MDT1-16]